MCVNLAGTHPHPLAHAVPCQRIVWEDMTACFGAQNVKMIPLRAFTCCPNRPHLAASMYCQQSWKEGLLVQYRGLAWAPPMDSFQLLIQEGKNIKRWWGKWSQRARTRANCSLYIFLWADMGNVQCTAKKSIYKNERASLCLKTVIAEWSMF